MSRIKVGDTVTMNNKALGMGEMFYGLAGIRRGVNYKVTGTHSDENTRFNEVYGGYVELDGSHEGFVMEDFDVVEAE